MGASNHPSEHEQDSDGEGLDEEQYAWLQEQLAQLGQLHITETTGVEEDEEEWEDPSGGILVNIFAACEEGDTDKLAASLQDLRSTEHSIDSSGPDGDTALHLACLYGHLPCVQALLAAGCSTSVTNPEDGSTALHDAAAGGHLEILTLLLSSGAAALLPAQDSDGDTPLHNAARGGHLASVQLLLQAGASPAVRNAAGNTAAQESDDEAVRQALQDALRQAAAAAAAAAGQPAAMDDAA